ncbi:MAG: class I mannose-6-phosphate isomerase [Halanaerobiales bacterium]|nr:class I mannose-6-phosphate isomerase [Halanaerobiales bacterium]
MELYPLKFIPIYINKIWGGNKLKNDLNKNTSQNNIGESWEVSTNKDKVSVVKNGSYKNEKLTDLIKKYPKELLGPSYNKNDKFPLLLKIIDATKKLSVQVHPNDKLAKKLENGNGKTEMWYVLDASKEAKLYIGLKQIENKKQLRKVIKEGKLENHLNEIEVSKGDFFFIPSGTVHAIGGGLMLVEIQQNSNTTYRLYDWNRVDDAGNSRELHLENGIKATNLNLNIKGNQVLLQKKTSEYKQEILCASDYFITNKIYLNGSLSIENENFVLLTCIKNEGKIYYGDNKSEDIKLGESVMLPANIKNVKLKGDMNLLKMYIPESLDQHIRKLKEKGFNKI